MPKPKSSQRFDVALKRLKEMEKVIGAEEKDSLRRRTNL